MLTFHTTSKIWLGRKWPLILERAITVNKREQSILLKVVEKERNYKFQWKVAKVSQKVNAETFLRRKRLILPLDTGSKDIKFIQIPIVRDQLKA